MKRALKIIIPIVVIIALLITAFWFFIFNRPDLTNKFLTGQAEKMVEKERYTRAIRYYSWACALEPDRDDLPILLADTYAKSGNYTKAEFTLVNAISQKPTSADLYAALCRVYVSQHKLLDATQMLDRTTDPTVKAQLDSLRPEAPLVTPDGGSYNEYIEVSAFSKDAKIYLTTNSAYPSSEDDLYTSPVKLLSGETKIIAVAVGENGLVSPVIERGYTIGGVVEAVTLTDAAIDQAVREQLGLKQDDVLMSDMLWSITTLSLPDTVKDISDLSRFTALRSLSIQGVSGLDFSVLTLTPSLRELDLSGCALKSASVESIATLTELEKLILDSCALTDISALSSLVNLKELCLSNNSITDIGSISLMADLESLIVSNNPLTNIAALSACTNLKYLDISNCTVDTLSNLSNLSHLETLLASNNKIKIISDLASCSNLSVFEINSNQVSDITVLTALPNLTRFEGDHNTISTIPDFDETTCILVYLSLNYNQISDVSGLAKISSLNYLNIDYNKVADLAPIAENANLIKVNAWDNPLSKECIDTLTSFEIIVNYNPNQVTTADE